MNVNTVFPTPSGKNNYYSCLQNQGVNDENNKKTVKIEEHDILLLPVEY